MLNAVFARFGGKGNVMAFINEKVTPEQAEEFYSMKIKEPIFGLGRIIKEIDMECPWHWTIDKERKMYLLPTSYDRDYHDERVFVFIWNNKNYLVQFNFSFEDGNTGVYNIPEKYLIDNTFPYCTEEHFLDDLRDALLVYGIFGTDKLNESGSVKCNF